jgi:hypothetical protein
MFLRVYFDVHGIGRDIVDGEGVEAADAHRRIVEFGPTMAGRSEAYVKHMQVIDGAVNTAYSICLVDDADFALIFPEVGQDVEFVEDLVERVGKVMAGKIVRRSTTRRIHKQRAMGIDGTLFFELLEKKPYYPTKRDSDIADPKFVD